MSLTDHLAEQEARIAVLKASEIELTDGADAALAALGPLTDPIRMRTALAILLRADRHNVAADLIRDRRVDDKWIDLAALVFAFLGEIGRARSLVERADSSPELPIMQSSRIGFAEGVLDQWKMRRPTESLLATQEWAETDIELAKTVIGLLDPLLAAVRAVRRIDSELTLAAVTYATWCARIAGDQQLFAQCTNWLLRHEPIPLIVAELSLRGLIREVPAGLPNRLRVEHSGDFQASFLAAMVQRELFGQFQEAFEAFVELSTRDLTEDDKESICVALFETCSQCGPPQMDRALQIITSIRPEDVRLRTFLLVAKHVAEGNLTEAVTQLNSVRNESDGVWWQVQAQLHEKLGEDEAAQRAWEKASDMFPHPSVIRRSIKASIDRKKYQSAVRELRKALQTEPTNEQHLKVLAWTLAQLNDHASAVPILSQLVEIAPSNDEYRQALAQSLARTARIGEAIQALRPVCEKEEPPIDALLLQSEFLGTNNEQAAAFRLLDSVAADHWDEPRFLLTYVKRGHAAGEDKLAHQAFARLIELRREGRVAPELLQERTLEQLLEYGKDYRARGDTLRQLMVAGRMPWLMAENALGNPAVWAWMLHTQNLTWVSEEPQNRAAFSVYASNGFASKNTPDGRMQLQEILAPDAGTNVVADLSALITLHSLGKLESVADYFGCFILPASYGDLHMREADRFGQHQPSCEAELRKIRNEIDRGHIRIISGEAADVPLVDEYSDDASTRAFRLQDFIPLLQQTQRAPLNAIDEFRKVAHKPSTLGEDRPGFTLGANVLIDLMSLRTLANQAVFEPILNSVTINIRATDHRRLVDEIQAYETAHRAKNAHDALWQAITTLASAQKIRWQPCPASQGNEEEVQEDNDASVFMDAIKIARQLAAPLLADDRVLQVLAFHETPDMPTAAFGTDSVLRALSKRDVGILANIAPDFLRLIEWRYRFLVPSPEMLTFWAEGSKNNLPGPVLLSVAAYLHDCLRDPGLHCGPEACDPPIPMGVKNVTAWIFSITSFLARVWNEPSFSNDQCAALTQWVGEDFLPSCPWGLWLHEAGQRLTQGASVFSMAVVQFSGVQNRERANHGLRLLAEALGLDEHQYVLATTNAIRVSEDRPDSAAVSEEDELLFSRIIMQNALLHHVGSGLHPLSVSRLQEVGLLKDLSPPPLPSKLIDVLRVDIGQAQGTYPSPLIAIRETQSASIIEIQSIVMHPNLDLRRATLAYVQAAASLPDSWLTPYSASVLSDQASDINSESEHRWRPAANKLADALRDDLFLDFAALRHAGALKYQEGINLHVGRIVNPTFESLLHLRPPLWSATEQRKEIDDAIAEFALLPKVDEALTEYYKRYGYLSLCETRGASQVVRCWMTNHPTESPQWDHVWAWATSVGTPFARYHAVFIALQVQALRPVGSMDQLWTEVAAILDQTTSGQAAPEANHEWQMYCELASHFCRHIESLHPGQDGERAACYAWWLAEKVGSIVGGGAQNIANFMAAVLKPNAHFSHFRWTVSRSPIVPSPLRHATLHLRSMWAASILAQLSSVARSMAPLTIPDAVKNSIGDALHGYLLVGPIADNTDGGTFKFAFQDTAALEDLCTVDGFLPEGDRQEMSRLIAVRRYLASPQNLDSCFEQWAELPPHIQHITMLALRTRIYASTANDAVLTKWLEQTTKVVQVLLHAGTEIVDPLLEILAEFQQHHVENWPNRLPHMIAYAVEESDSPERVALLAPHVLQMALNYGLASPIQRFSSSNKLPDWHEAIRTWRENLVDIARISEPWVAARIRAVSASVSRLIGPRRRASDV